VHVPETRAFLKHQKDILADAANTAPLDHVLFKECVVSKGQRLTRQYYTYDGTSGGALVEIAVRQSLETLNPDGTMTRRQDPTVTRDLVAKLRRYNDGLIAAGETAEIPEEIRTGLRDLGYRL